jgi:phage shock protein C
MVLGICGGLAEYFNIDPVLTRIGTVLLAVITAAFPVLLVYIVCGIIIPLEPERT